MKTYVSTRGKQTPVNFYQAIVQGIADDGGLLVPDFDLPVLDLDGLLSSDYVSLASTVLSSFVPEDARKLIEVACVNAYGKGLFPEEIVPLRKAGDVWIAELFHGKTAAFKDMALSLLPHLMNLSMGQIGEKRQVMILVATSGDTGKAALEGFKNVAGTQILVFYPTDGVSAVQKRQMLSQEGENVTVCGIRGNFDDAQRAVKTAFADEKILEICRQNGVFLSSANSINIGRLIPQIVYYVWSYLELVRKSSLKMGDKVNFCVPSGNFGNCLAGWLAKSMGVPVGRFLVASNKNHILTDFFNTGIYDSRREFFKTNAPAMDILVSSNLERLLWFITARDAERVSGYMEKLKSEGAFEIDGETLGLLQREFSAGFLDESEVFRTIRDCYAETSYLLDTHTACGYGFLKQYHERTCDVTPTILMSTASPYKFPEAVYSALSGKETDAYEAIDSLCKLTNINVPPALSGIKDRKILHKEVIDKADIPAFIASSVRK